MRSIRREVERSWADLEKIAVGELTAAEQSGALDVLQRLEANLDAAARSTTA